MKRDGDLLATIVVGVAAMLALVFTASADAAPQRPGKLVVGNCEEISELRMVDGQGVTVAVGQRVALPPYHCAFHWEYRR